MSRTSSQQRVLDAATEAFAERGYHGTTTRDIAERAGMSAAAIYVHFRCKEQLLFEISKDANEHTLDAIRTAAAEAVSPTERLGAAVYAFVLSHARRHTRGRIVNYELASLAAEHTDLIEQQRRSVKAVFRSAIEAGIATGEFTVADPSVATLGIVSLGIDVARWYSEDKQWAPEYVAEQYREMALRIVGVRPA